MISRKLNTQCRWLVICHGVCFAVFRNVYKTLRTRPADLTTAPAGPSKSFYIVFQLKMRNFITEAMLLARLAAAAATHISGDMRVIGVRESLQAATASDVLSKAIDAIGGLVALNMVAGVTYHSS